MLSSMVKNTVTDPLGQDAPRVPVIDGKVVGWVLTREGT